jgi:hypothetical protein
MYSQNNEEQVIKEYFGDFKGRFLDLGAYDGKTFSNTHQLALDGWNGVCVEASARPFASLCDLYRENQDIVLVNACILPDVLTAENIIPFYDSQGDAISTFDKLLTERWTETKWRKTWVMPMYFSQIERAFGNDYDFVNIDIEGGTIDLAIGMNFETTQLLCLEHDRDFARCAQIAKVWDFEEIHRNGENIILGRKKDGD